MRTTIVIMIRALISISLTSVNAQIPTAQVNLDCDDAISMDSSPGSESSTVLVSCTMSNPTSAEEKVEFNGTGDEELTLDFVDGHEFIIPAGGSVEANVSVTILEGASNASYALEFTAQVTEMDGVPPANIATDSQDTLVNLVQDSDDEDEEVPFFGFFATLSVVCLAFAFCRNDQRCLDDQCDSSFVLE